MARVYHRIHQSFSEAKDTLRKKVELKIKPIEHPSRLNTELFATSKISFVEKFFEPQYLNLLHSSIVLVAQVTKKLRDIKSNPDRI